MNTFFSCSRGTLWYNVPQMKQPKLDDEVKLRVPPEMKRQLEKMAAVEMVSVSDVVRRAVSNHIKRSSGKELTR